LRLTAKKPDFAKFLMEPTNLYKLSETCLELSVEMYFKMMLKCRGLSYENTMT
jgi:hypothetical protein